VPTRRRLPAPRPCPRQGAEGPPLGPGHTTRRAHPLRQQLGQPGGIRGSRLGAAARPPVSPSGSEHRHRGAQHVRDWLPVPTSALQRPSGTMVGVPPGAQGPQRTGGGARGVPLGREVAVCTAPAQTGRARRGLDVDTATDRRAPRPGASRLHARVRAAGPSELPAPGALCPRVLCRVDLGGDRARDRPFPLRVQCPKVNRSSG
jgi:hypothetical protein